MKNLYSSPWAWHFPILKDFFYDISSDINECDLLIPYNEICNYLYYLHNLVNWYPNNEWMMLQNYAWVKNSLKVWDRPGNFNIKEYKEILAMVSDSILQLPFKKSFLVKFWHNIREEYPQLSEKAIKRSSTFPTTYLNKARSSSHTSTKTTTNYRL